MNFIARLFAPRHEHNWELVAVNDKYHTTYTDTKQIKHWSMRFYKCDCGTRKYSDDRSSKYIGHEGMDKAQANWIDAGVVPQDSYHPANSKHYVKIDSVPEEKIDPVEKLNRNLEDMAKLMGVVKRDFDLEAKYPRLQKTADEYFRLLDKYRMVETLKGEKNES